MVKLSIVVPVYNHERYIGQTIDGILMQKVDFDYEVLIGEDCSTDGSRAVLEKIEKKCPPNFHFIYRETNYGIKKNFGDLYARTTGKYLAVVEGDDFWTDENKLQKQVDFLDRNPDHYACAHDVFVVDENSWQTDYVYPGCRDNEYTFHHFEENILPGQTASIISRNYYLPESGTDTSILNVDYYAGDRKRTFMMLVNGKIYCFPEKMSAYRYVTAQGSSFSANMRETKETHLMDVSLSKAMIAYAQKHKNKEAEKAATARYILNLYGLMRFDGAELSFPNFLKLFVASKYKIHTGLRFLRVLFARKNDPHEVK